MQKITKNVRLMLLVILLGVCFTAVSVKAQSPADDPGIGGPGAPGDGPSGDGSPTVPFDGGMSLVLLAGGIAYGALSHKGRGVCNILGSR